jgi:hypothetical protein
MSSWSRRNPTQRVATLTKWLADLDLEDREASVHRAFFSGAIDEPTHKRFLAYLDKAKTGRHARRARVAICRRLDRARAVVREAQKAGST